MAQIHSLKNQNNQSIDEPMVQNQEQKPEEQQTSSVRYQRTSDFVEIQLLETLSYVDAQLDKADLQSNDITKFSKHVYEAKKLLIEQKIHILKTLTSLSIDRMKLGAGSGDEIKDITSLLGDK